GFTVPENITEPLTIDVKLQYRKFDTKYMQHVFGKTFTSAVPIPTIASDRVTFPIEGLSPQPTNDESKIVLWQRWNDYGIGLFLEGDRGAEKGELIQAGDAFAEVEKLG